MRRENDGDRKGSERLDSVHVQRLTAFSLQPKHLVVTILIHQYDHVDLDEVWQTVSVDVPTLIALLEPLAPREGSE